MRSAVDWVAGLSPWPEEFGLARMRALLTDLGEPQRAYPSIHVVGTNGKSTATRTIEELLRAEGLRVGAYLSPHVSGWSERIRVHGDEVDLERALELRGRGKGDKEVYLVHDRLGQPCPQCGTPIARVDFEEHTIYYCPTCQTGGKPLADRRMSKLLK